MERFKPLKREDNRQESSEEIIERKLEKSEKSDEKKKTNPETIWEDEMERLRKKGKKIDRNYYKEKEF
ncbi:MAG: hypothetical protein KatS3mg095_0542 [Candidatus Parcubacteria bacterium]|nr:MAG: hypothetical protein KatS3mg095_0542 [Candidatus Parcubacteria bacterium]